MLYILNEKELHNKVTGKNKSFMTRTINTQQKKYGNVDIFSCVVDTDEWSIKIALGESQGLFRQSWITGEWELDYGNLYKIPQCTEIVKEIAKLYLLKGDNIDG